MSPICHRPATAHNNLHCYYLCLQQHDPHGPHCHLLIKTFKLYRNIVRREARLHLNVLPAYSILHKKNRGICWMYRRKICLRNSICYTATPVRITSRYNIESSFSSSNTGSMSTFTLRTSPHRSAHCSQ